MEANKYIQLAKKWQQEISSFIELGAYQYTTEEVTTEDEAKAQFLEQLKAQPLPEKITQRRQREQDKIKDAERTAKWCNWGLIVTVVVFGIYYLVELKKGYAINREEGTVLKFAFGLIVVMGVPTLLLLHGRKLLKKSMLPEQKAAEMTQRHYAKMWEQEKATGGRFWQRVGQPKKALRYYYDSFVNMDKVREMRGRIIDDILILPNQVQIFQPPQKVNLSSLKNHFNYYLGWLRIELENLTNYIEGATAKEDYKTNLYIGEFEPNYTDEQQAIGRYIQHITKEELFTTVAEAVGLKRADYKTNAKVFKTSESENKAAIIRSFDTSTDKMATTTKEDTGGFFLPRFKALVPFKARLGHTYIIGGSGSGKSELIKLFIYNDIQQESGTLLLDPHGEIAAEVSALELFKKHPENLVYITPTIKGYIPKYNPLEYRYDHIQDEKEKLKLIKVRATELTNAFEVIAKKDFTGQMKNLVKFSLIVLLHHKNMKLGDLMDFMDDDRNAKYIAKAKKINDSYVKDFFAEGGDFHKKTFESTKTGVRQRLMGLLVSGLFADIVDTNKSSFDIIQPLKDGKTVVMDLSKGDISKEAMQALGAFFISEVATWGYGRKKGQGRRVFIYADECQNFVSPVLAEALEEIRKYRVHFTMANQGLYQFAKEGLPALQSAILTNTKVKFIGKVPRKREQTLMTEGEGNGVDIAGFQESHKIGKWLMLASGGRPKKVTTDTMLIAGDGLQVLGKPHYQTKEDYKEMIVEQREKYYVKDSSAPKKKNKPVEAPHEPKTNSNGERPPTRPKM